MSRYQEWLKNNPQPLDMNPEEQRDYRKKIVTGCVGIDDCWMWAGARTEAGYGTIRVGVSNRVVSRLALCLRTGLSLSTPADACHIPECLSRACCNPAHLFWGDHKTNCSAREQRDLRWERYIAALTRENKSVFVVFEKRYKLGWGWLDCRTVHASSHWSGNSGSHGRNWRTDSTKYSNGTTGSGLPRAASGARRPEPITPRCASGSAVRSAAQDNYWCGWASRSQQDGDPPHGSIKRVHWMGKGYRPLTTGNED